MLPFKNLFNLDVRFKKMNISDMKNANGRNITITPHFNLQVGNHFPMDPMWEVFGFNSDADVFYKKMVPELFLKKAVDKDIKENIRVVRKLIQLSYCEYKFYDIAAEKVIFTLEMAMKIRYRELEGKEWKRGDGMDKLVAWFQQRHYIDANDPEYLDRFRKIRNEFAHPVKHRFAGPNMRYFIEQVVLVINELYDDPVLCKERKEFVKLVMGKLNSFNGRIRCETKNSVLFSYYAWVGFYDNRSVPAITHFYFNPEFTVPGGKPANVMAVPPFIYVKAVDCQVTDDSIVLKDHNGETLIVSAITDPEELAQYHSWVSQNFHPALVWQGLVFKDGHQVDTSGMHLKQFQKTYDR